jgi:hypothetical protein
MPVNKEFNKLASQLSQLAKFYLSHLGGTPAEVAKREKDLLNHVKKSHQQLRTKGTSLIRASNQARSFEDDNGCPGMYKCDDGTCVPSADCCGGESGLMAQPVAQAKAKPAAKKPAKKAAKKK